MYFFIQEVKKLRRRDASDECLLESPFCCLWLHKLLYFYISLTSFFTFYCYYSIFYFYFLLIQFFFPPKNHHRKCVHLINHVLVRIDKISNQKHSCFKALQLVFFILKVSELKAVFLEGKSHCRRHAYLHEEAQKWRVKLKGNIAPCKLWYGNYIVSYINHFFFLMYISPQQFPFSQSTAFI